MSNYIFGFLVFLLLVYLYYVSNYVYSAELNGAWCSTSDFSKAADIDDMIMFINTKTKKAYFLIYKNQKVVYDKVLDFNVKAPWLPFIRQEAIFSVKMDPLEDIIPEDCLLKLKLGKGRIKLYDDEKVYAKMQRLNF